MKVILDNIVFSLQKAGGISVCWNEHLNRALSDTDLDCGLIEYSSQKENIHRTNKFENTEQKVVKHIKVNPKLYRFFDEKYSEVEGFIFHSSDYRINSSSHAVNFLTIHDLMYFGGKWRGISVWIARFFHKRRLIKSVKKADEIICISHSTKSDLLKHVKIAESKNVSVIHNGISTNFTLLPSDPDSLKYPKHSYVLYVGGRNAYKNFLFVLKCMKLFNKKLVIVGQTLSKSERITVEQYLNEDDYSLVINPSNQELNILYNFAFCLFYPSEYEGFGMPVIEAQKAGCPVIAFSRTSIPEIYGIKDKLLLSELNLEEVKKCVCLLSSENNRMEIIQSGIENSKRFTWENNYLQTKKLYLKYQ